MVIRGTKGRAETWKIDGTKKRTMTVRGGRSERCWQTATHAHNERREREDSAELDGGDWVRRR